MGALEGPPEGSVTRCKPTPILSAPTPVPSCRTGRKCDCLNDCGDDPWLRDGKADPCEKLLKARADWDATMTAEKALALLNAGQRVGMSFGASPRVGLFFDDSQLPALRAAIVELGTMADRSRGWRP